MENNAQKTILTVSDISIGYHGADDAVKNVSFEVNNGDFLLIVGENGSGKSTLLKGILGLVRKSGGKIVYNDESIAKKTGYLPQQNDIPKDFPATVKEVVMSGFVGKKGVFSFYTKRDRKKASDILSYLGLEKLSGKHFSALSGGERQRVLLARALVSATDCDVCTDKHCHCHDETFCHTSGLIVLDEPSNGLDPIANRNLYKTLDDLRRDKGMTIIMVSHLVDSVMEYATKVLHMGREMRFFGTREEYIKTELCGKFSGKESESDE
ncbi:MAG: metal ABC transporter ATP-binding protein [Ruminococcaceae bacterium]|nr:metal ABC transporter ATP-binding protein [Oscillospiraceae bacterium]